MKALRFASYLFAGKAAVALPFMSIHADDSGTDALQAALSEAGVDSVARGTSTTSGITIHETGTVTTQSDSYGQGEVATMVYPVTDDTLNFQVKGMKMGDEVWFVSSLAKDGWNLPGEFAPLRVGTPDNFTILLQQKLTTPYYSTEAIDVNALSETDITFRVNIEKLGLSNPGDIIYVQAVVLRPTYNPFTEAEDISWHFSELDAVQVSSGSTY